MNLNIFARIDEIVECYARKKDEFNGIAQEIKTYLEDFVCSKSIYTLSVVYRIKEDASIREKLIRNSYYRKYKTADEVISRMQDIIGLRIECKFTDDEEYVYKLLVSLFDKTDDYSYFYNEENPEFKLKLGDKQPQKQKNGFDIYKIDGKFEGANGAVNFELQIKSLVNVFWGDIEHKIIYKNSTYVVVDDIVKEMMVSIKENLNLIDRQLHQLYGKYKREDNSHIRFRKRSIDALMSKMIHDTVANKMRNSLGFVVDFKKSCDSIVQYLLVVNNAAEMEDYGTVLMDVLYITNLISTEEMFFDEKIIIDSPAVYDDDSFCTKFQKLIFELINIDFQWHLFFLMLFKIDRGRPENILESYIRYYKSQFGANASIELLFSKFGEKLGTEIKKELLDKTADIIAENPDISMLWKSGIAEFLSAVSRTVEVMVMDTGFDWQRDKGKYLSMMQSFYYKK